MTTERATKKYSSDEDFHTADEDNNAVGAMSTEAVLDAKNISENINTDENNNNEDVYESSDDEAPEEEDVQQSRKQVEEKQSEALKLAQQERQKVKEQRRLQDLKFKEQKQQKQEKQVHRRVEVPDVLPDSLLEGILNEDTQQQQQQSVDRKQNTHINFDHDDYEDTDDISDADLNKQLRKTKLKISRQMNKSTKKIGSINVKLLKAKQSKLPPAAKSQVTSMKNKWLKRNSLHKKRGY